MDPAKSQSLFEQVVRQAEYPGEVCAADHILAGYLANTLAADERIRLDQHLAECEGCRNDLAALAAEATWFDANRDAMLARARDRAESAGFLARQLYSHELELYVRGNIPQTSQGQKLRQRVESALARDPASRAEAERLKQLLAGLVVLSLADATRQSQLVALLTAMQVLARAQAMRRRTQTMPGHRAANDEQLTALVVDTAGQPVLDDDGRPATVTFHVVRAVLEADGRCVIDLSTAQTEYWATKQHAYEVVATLQHAEEAQGVVLPAEEIYANGRVTVAARLPAGIEIDPLPTESLRLQVRPQAVGGKSSS